MRELTVQQAQRREKEANTFSQRRTEELTKAQEQLRQEKMARFEEVSKLQQQVKSLEWDLNRRNSELDVKRHGETERLRSELRAKELSVKDAESKASDLQNANRRQQDEIQRLQNEIRQEQQKRQTLERERDSSRSNNLQLETALNERNSARRQIDELQQQNRELLAQLAALRSSRTSSPTISSHHSSPVRSSPTNFETSSPVRSSPVREGVYTLTHLEQGGSYLLPGVNKVRMGLGWNTKCDLDASVVALDIDGNYYDHVYFGKKMSKDTAIVHAGDQLSGDGNGDDETIDVSLDDISPEAVFLFFVVTVYTEGQNFSQVEGSYCRLLDISTAVPKAMARYELGSTYTGSSSANIFVCLHRDPQRLGLWKLLAMGHQTDGRSCRAVEPKCSELAKGLLAASANNLRTWVATQLSDRRQHFPTKTLAKSHVFDVPFLCSKVQMGLGWNTKADLDASVIVLDIDGQYYDHVYFGKRASKDAAIQHGGDHLAGGEQGDDETITVNLSNISPEAVFLFFVATCYTDGANFTQVDGAYCRLMDTTSSDFTKELAKYNLADTGSKTASVFVCLYRDPTRLGCWKLLAVGEPADGRSCHDVEPKCIELVKSLFQHDSTNLRNWLTTDIQRHQMPQATLDTGHSFAVPFLSNHIRMGLGWRAQCDLDASVVCLDIDGNYHDHVYFGKKTSKDGSIEHGGDQLSGDGDDDEVIDVRLTNVSKDVTFLFFVVTVYTDESNFGEVDGAYCRLLDVSTTTVKPMARFNLSDTGNKTAVIFACLHRDPSRLGCWMLYAMGKSADGKSCRDVEPRCTEEAKAMLIAPGADYGDLRHWLGIELGRRQGGVVRREYLMSYGSTFDIASRYSDVRMGLGWKADCDLDASVVMLDANGQYYDHVYFGKKVSKDNAVRHGGDQLTGEGQGETDATANTDDEVIDVSLKNVSPEVSFLFFVVTVYTEGNNFSEVKGAYCRLLDVTTVVPKAIARFNLTQNGTSTANIFAALHRSSPVSGWKMAAIGKQTEGHSCRDVEPKCMELSKSILAGSRSFL
eukprot:TRINITY_DN57328_c0_g1_i1.p1 TRINITY_DN57328_c0_g1~~TRINITY_DN57328_c0_g1_i1.p1  ORF type:complete len:1132 (+),score=171.60 TRINITY_DN57328_c0_g1_i1:287-3397(+)